jgi:hypothetical protein
LVTLTAGVIIISSDFVCSGLPGPSVCLFDFHENKSATTEHHLPQNPSCSFTFKSQTYLFVFRGDFFDIVHVVSTVTKRLNTLSSPLRYKKQFKITFMEQVKTLQDAESPNRSAKIQVIYDTLKPAKNSAHLVHFALTLELEHAQKLTTLLTLDMENQRLSEFTYFHPDTRQLDVKFKKSLDWPFWKRLPVLKVKSIFDKIWIFSESDFEEKSAFCAFVELLQKKCRRARSCDDARQIRRF